MSDTRAVRPSEQLDWGAVAEYLRRELGLTGELSVAQFGGGHSNLTYELRIGGSELVLRRPPFGPLPPRAHDVAREYRLLVALHPHFPLAPRPYALCEDSSLIGSVFYVMERRHGVVIRSDEPAETTPETRASASAAMIDALAALRAIDVHATALDALGKPEGFVARQIHGWSERWQRSRTSDVPDMEWLARWLSERIPEDPARPAVVHGDFKLDNAMLSDDLRRVTAIFDWEMSAIGDPLIDLGIVLCYWVHAAGDEAMPTVTTRPGWYKREEILTRYEQASNTRVGDITLYEVFAVFKVAVVIQQIYARYVRGQTDDPRFAPLGEKVAAFAAIARRLARG